MSLLGFGIEAAERGLIPDSMTRLAMRRLCRARSRDSRLTPAVVFLESMRQGPIALVTDKANEQHYELPPEFFAAVLGPLEIQLLLLARRGYDAGERRRGRPGGDVRTCANCRRTGNSRARLRLGIAVILARRTLSQ